MSAARVCRLGAIASLCDAIDCLDGRIDQRDLVLVHFTSTPRIRRIGAEDSGAGEVTSSDQALDGEQ